MFVLSFSTNASWEPLTTISFLGVSIPLLSKPLTSTTKAILRVSTKSAQSPEVTLLETSENLVTFFTVF